MTTLCEFPTIGNDPADIDRILSTTRTIAIVGLSSDPGRVSNEIGGFLQETGFRIVPVNPKESKVFGIPSFPDVESLPEPPDLVLVFRRPEAVPPIIEGAILRRARAIWLQSGIVHNGSARKAQEAGLLVIQNRCIRTELQMRPGFRISLDPPELLR